MINQLTHDYLPNAVTTHAKKSAPTKDRLTSFANTDEITRWGSKSPGVGTRFNSIPRDDFRMVL